MNNSLITFVLPCYNERELAIANIGRLHKYLEGMGWNYEILICDDNSNDGTTELLEQLRLPKVQIKKYTSGPSRRENLALALNEGRGEVLVYMDMDLSTSLNNLPALINAIIHDDYDIAIGSRYEKGALVKREFLRFFYSVCYNSTIRWLFGSRILDHQCGFKAIRREVYLPLMKELGYDEEFRRGWFWDAELLIRAQRKNLRILELPVHWTRAEKSSFSFVRELKVIPYMFRLKRRLAAEQHRSAISHSV